MPFRLDTEIHHVSIAPNSQLTSADQECRRVTISLDTSAAPQLVIDQEFLSGDLAAEMTIADLKSYIESETGVPSATQNISYNGQVLQDATRTLQQCQVTEDSMLGMHIRRQQAPSSRSARAAVADGRGAPQRPSRDEIETTRLRAEGDPAVLESLRSSYSILADNVNDSTRFHQAWEEIQRQVNHDQAEKQRKLAMLEADPFNVEAQREIEEMIRQEQVTENLQSAMEHNPEGKCP